MLLQHVLFAHKVCWLLDPDPLLVGIATYVVNILPESFILRVTIHLIYL
jgi:hypothetical protein